MNLLILVFLSQSLVSAKFNRRAALTKYHKDASDATTKPNDSKEEQPTADSTQEQDRAQEIPDDKLLWNRIRAAAIIQRKLTTDLKYTVLLQRLLIEEIERRQANKKTEKSLQYALYGMNLI